MVAKSSENPQQFELEVALMAVERRRKKQNSVREKREHRGGCRGQVEEK